ncbi:respiratory nitrate reductase subunit gamma [Mycobacterium leprae]|uniref:respiratory nitrate reductase subunit gamma n=1 Tax=Mycobacterium leprae TaxID=1769 RepID=UPI000B2DA427
MLYLVLAIAGIPGWGWYRYDKFGLTKHLSQRGESKLFCCLSIDSPMFHFGSLMVMIGPRSGSVYSGVLVLRRLG